MTNSYKIASRINSDVNASVTYKTDLAQYGKPEQLSAKSTQLIIGHLSAFVLHVLMFVPVGYFRLIA